MIGNSFLAGTVTGGEVHSPDLNGDAGSTAYVTKAEVETLVKDIVGSLRIYVLESDITEAQNSIRAIVERSSF